MRTLWKIKTKNRERIFCLDASVSILELNDSKVIKKLKFKARTSSDYSKQGMIALRLR